MKPLKKNGLGKALPRNVVTFKPGKEMEERVGSMVVEGNSQAAREAATDRPAPGRSPKASSKPKKQASSRPV